MSKKIHMWKVKKTIRRLNKNIASPEYAGINEAQTQDCFVVPFLNAFGWSADDINKAASQCRLASGSVIPDYCLKFDGDIRIVIEVKRLGSGLSRGISQLEGQFNSSTADIGILTNGIQYWFFSWYPKLPRMNITPYAVIDIRDIKLNKEDRFLRYFAQDEFNARYFKWFSHADYIFGKLFNLLGSDILTVPSAKRFSRQAFFYNFKKYDNPKKPDSGNLPKKKIRELYHFGWYHSRWNYRHDCARVAPMK